CTSKSNGLFFQQVCSCAVLLRPFHGTYSRDFYTGWCTSRLYRLGMEQYFISAEKMYGDQRPNRIFCFAHFGGSRFTKGLHPPGLCHSDLYIPRLYSADGEYVSPSAFQY